MKAFKKKLQELVYSFSTEDRYADYDENSYEQTVNRGGSRNESQIQLADFVEGSDSNSDGNDGISETLLAWRHIESWANEYNPDLLASLSDPCTRHDIDNAERDLKVKFPACVRASLRLHDGQEDLESLAGTSGLIFGLQLMSLDQIVQMAKMWRNVADNLELKQKNSKLSLGKQQEVNATSVDLPGEKLKGYGKVDNEDFQAKNTRLEKNIRDNYRRQFKMPDIPIQDSIPPLAVQRVYANYGWIPLVTDNAGNHIGIDLAPGPKGTYGQVILFGREFDTKFVVANNWGDFLLSFANDLVLGNWLLVNEGTNDQFSGEGDLVFRDKQKNGPIRDYLEILVFRSRTKWGPLMEKKLPKRPLDKTQSPNELDSKKKNTDIVSNEKDKLLQSSSSSESKETNQGKDDSTKTEEILPVESIATDENSKASTSVEIETLMKTDVLEATSESIETQDSQTSESNIVDSENAKDTSSSNKEQIETPAIITTSDSVEGLKDDFENVAL